MKNVVAVFLFFCVSSVWFAPLGMAEEAPSKETVEKSIHAMKYTVPADVLRAMANLRSSHEQDSNVMSPNVTLHLGNGTDISGQLLDVQTQGSRGSGVLLYEVADNRNRSKEDKLHYISLHSIVGVSIAMPPMVNDRKVKDTANVVRMLTTWLRSH